MAEDVCTICAEVEQEDNPLTRLDSCGHVFHANCIVNWFRSGNDSCPNCRSTDLGRRLRMKTLGQRIAEMKRKDTSPEMKKILRRLEDYSVTMKTRKYKEREFMSTNANVLKEYRRIRRMAIQSRLRYHRYRRFVGTCVPSTVSFATWQAMDRRER